MTVERSFLSLFRLFPTTRSHTIRLIPKNPGFKFWIWRFWLCVRSGTSKKSHLAFCAIPHTLLVPSLIRSLTRPIHTFMIQSAHLSIRRRYQISQLFVLLFLCGVILLLSQSGAGSLFAKRNAVNVSQVKSNQVHTAEASVVASPLATTDSSFWMNSLQKFISKRRKLFASFASSSSKKSTVVPTGSLATTSNNGNDAIFQSSESSTNVTKCVEEEKVVVWDYIQFLELGSAVILVCLSGLFSGLTLGLLGLDKTTLDVCIFFDCICCLLMMMMIVMVEES